MFMIWYECNILNLIRNDVVWDKLLLEKPSTLNNNPTGEEIIIPLGEQSHRLQMRDSWMIYISVETGKEMIYISIETGKEIIDISTVTGKLNDWHQYWDWK